jgi:hypothetical protein
MIPEQIALARRGVWRLGSNERCDLATSMTGSRQLSFRKLLWHKDLKFVQ